MSEAEAVPPRKPGAQDMPELSRASGSAVETPVHMGGIRHLLHTYATIAPFIVLVLSVVAFGFIAGNRFFHPFNLSLIIQQVSIIGILAAAQSLVILTAGIDLSVAAIMALCSVVMGTFAVELGVPTLVAIPAGFVLGALCGLINGFLVTTLRLPPFIVTLGTWNIFFCAEPLVLRGSVHSQPGH